MQSTRFVWDHFDIALRKEPCFFFFFKQPAVSNQAREHAAVEDALIILSCRFFLKRIPNIWV